MPAVQTTNLTRVYGNMTALNSLTLTVNRGDLFGFIGSNGAGKTTTLRILATFLAPSSGKAEILGHDVVQDADRVRHIIGYMPDFFGVYKDMEVTEYLDFFGACYKIPSVQREKTVNDVLELTASRADMRLRGWSSTKATGRRFLPRSLASAGPLCISVVSTG